MCERYARLTRGFVCLNRRRSKRSISRADDDDVAAVHLFGLSLSFIGSNQALGLCFFE